MGRATAFTCSWKSMVLHLTWQHGVWWASQTKAGRTQSLTFHPSAIPLLPSAPFLSQSLSIRQKSKFSPLPQSLLPPAPHQDGRTPSPAQSPNAATLLRLHSCHLLWDHQWRAMASSWNSQLSPSCDTRTAARLSTLPSIQPLSCLTARRPVFSCHASLL